MSLNEFEIAALAALRSASRDEPAKPGDRLALESLTAAELQVLHHVARGLNNAEIGRLLQKSPATVKNQLRSVYGKLGVKNRVRLLARLLGG